MDDNSATQISAWHFGRNWETVHADWSPVSPSLKCQDISFEITSSFLSSLFSGPIQQFPFIIYTPLWIRDILQKLKPNPSVWPIIVVWHWLWPVLKCQETTVKGFVSGLLLRSWFLRLLFIGKVDNQIQMLFVKALASNCVCLCV